MPHYKDYSYEQHKFILVSFQQQILPGTLEYTLNYLRWPFHSWLRGLPAVGVITSPRFCQQVLVNMR